jgi:hypothetical protein
MALCLSVEYALVCPLDFNFEKMAQMLKEERTDEEPSTETKRENIFYRRLNSFFDAHG